MLHCASMIAFAVADWWQRRIALIDGSIAGLRG
jgi:hypothetical protein